MAKVSREGRQRYQVNVPLDDEHWYIALLQLAIREDKTVPDLLRPVIAGYLRRQLNADSSLAAAVKSLEEAKASASEKTRRRRHLADVKEMPVTDHKRHSSG
jgi:hypothetical protein